LYVDIPMAFATPEFFRNFRVAMEDYHRLLWLVCNIVPNLHEYPFFLY